MRGRPQDRVGCRSHRGRPGADFRPLRLTVAYHAPCQQQGYGIGERLAAGPGNGHLAGPIDDLATRLR